MKIRAMLIKPCYLGALVTLLSLPLMAEDDLGSWELDFQIDQKSTIQDFPMEEIDGEELSNAAVEGALLTTVAYEEEKGKPAFTQEQEVSDKRKVDEFDTDDLDVQRKASELFRLGQINAPEAPIPPPIYSAPTGRTYDHLETTTVER